MKNLRFFLPIIIAVIGVVLFSQCKKKEDQLCKMRIICRYSPNGIDAGGLAPMTIITFDTTKYLNGKIDSLINLLNKDINTWSNDSLYSWCEHGCLFCDYRVDTTSNPAKIDTIIYKYQGVAKENGVFEYSLSHPALLIVNAIKVDAIKDSLDSIVGYVRYEGTAQIQVNEGETTEKTLLMTRVN